MTEVSRVFRLLSALLIVTFCGTLAGTVRPALAGRNPNAKFVLHLVPFTNRSTCLNGRVEQPDAITTRGDLSPSKYIAYVLVVDGTPGAGLAGCQFGISYNDSTNRGVDVLDWTECSLFNWPEQGWPDSGTGNLLTWNQQTDCDTTGIRVVGYFTLVAHSPDRFSIIVRPADQKAAVAACKTTNITPDSESLDLIVPENLGFVDFGGGPGYNPWDPKQNLLKFRSPGFKSPGSREKSEPPAPTPTSGGKKQKKNKP